MNPVFVLAGKRPKRKVWAVRIDNSTTFCSACDEDITRIALSVETYYPRRIGFRYKTRWYCDPLCYKEKEKRECIMGIFYGR